MNNGKDIPVISTGQPSTLRTYRQIAFFLDGLEEGAATKFIDEKIAETSEDEIVIADERQMIYVLMTISQDGSKNE